jgi:hypothetical protein
MPRITDLSGLSTMGVALSTCTTAVAVIQPSATSVPSNTKPLLLGKRWPHNGTRILRGYGCCRTCGQRQRTRCPRGPWKSLRDSHSTHSPNRRSLNDTNNPSIKSGQLQWRLDRRYGGLRGSVALEGRASNNPQAYNPLYPPATLGASALSAVFCGQRDCKVVKMAQRLTPYPHRVESFHGA